MRIVFMGTPQPAADVLESLLKSDHDIVLVVSQPDRPKGRGKKLAVSQVKEVALKNNLPIAQPEKVKDPAFIGKVKDLKPDAIVVVAYGRILPKAILAVPKQGCLNLHASLLPKYRGASPIQSALLNGDTETGITVMKIDEGLDTGEMIAQDKIVISPDDDAISLSEKLFAVGGKLLVQVLKEIELGKVKYVKQDNSQATQAPLIKKEQGIIDWNKSAAEIHNKIRALVAWPGAQTVLAGKRIKIYKSELRTDNSELRTGQIIEIIKQKGFVVSTGEGSLLVREVQAEGKKRMSAFDFALGQQLNVGTNISA
ncbi:MAG: methionyl-tRNA formyltransferase [bacterium]